ncbi:hypothetical protein [Desulfocastanea catecholica]
MTELLIIKAGESYFRCREDNFEPCDLSKASVFPLEQADKARHLCKKLQETGVVGAELRKLSIIEECYEPLRNKKI